MKTTLHPCDISLGVPDRGLRTAGTSAVGRLGEELAAAHLQREHGCEVLARNWRTGDRARPGELDLIVADHRHGWLVVVEVKTRRDAERFGGAMVAVPPRQQVRLRTLTRCYLAVHRPPYPRVRLDLVAIDVTTTVRLQHLRGVL